jgi:hypothetical protein
MKSSRILPFAMLFATTTVFGQSLFAGKGTDCPVGLQVDHQWSLQEREVIVGPPEAGLRQRFHLTMTNPQPRKIVGAQLTVHGFSRKAREMDLSTPAPDMVKTIHLALNVDGNGQRSSDLSLSLFAVVTAVDVDAVTYADGSRWSAASAGVCSVTPNALMRVAAAR